MANETDGPRAMRKLRSRGPQATAHTAQSVRYLQGPPGARAVRNPFGGHRR